MTERTRSRLALAVPLWLAGCGVSHPLSGDEPLPEDCADLADNDQDGYTDCADPDCGGLVRCSDDFDPEQDPDGVPETPDAGPDPAPDAERDDDGAVDESAPDDGTQQPYACEPSDCVEAGGSHCCDGECINYYIDLDNCGACGAKCLRGTCDASFCLCNGEWPDLCGSYETDNLCTNFRTDAQNCGGCGQVCPVEQSCCDGVCGEC